MRGVGDELSVHAPDARGAQRAVPRNIAHHQRRARANEAENVRIVFTIGTEDDGLGLDFIVPAFGEQRTERAIRQAAGEDFFFGRTAFALEVTARELAGRGRFLAVIDGQREEILAFLGLGRSDSGDEDDGFAELNGDSTVCLFGEFPGFNNDLILPNGGSDSFWHISFLPPLPPRNFSELRKLSELIEITQGQRNFYATCLVVK